MSACYMAYITDMSTAYMQPGPLNYMKSVCDQCNVLLNWQSVYNIWSNYWLFLFQYYINHYFICNVKDSLLHMDTHRTAGRYKILIFLSRVDPNFHDRWSVSGGLSFALIVARESSICSFVRFATAECMFYRSVSIGHLSANYCNISLHSDGTKRLQR
jgi:hypothetical protein